MSEAYPLHWPKGWPRTNKPVASRFKVTIAGALRNVNGELQRFANDSGKKITSIVISSNVTLGNQNPQDPGVAVYFNWDGISTCIAVDRYKKVQDNLQAIFYCLDAERTKLRHGGINLVKAAFRGYAALPPPGTDEGDWWFILELDRSASLSEVKRAFKRLAAKFHPDKPNGDKTKFAIVNAAYKEAIDSIGRS